MRTTPPFHLTGFHPCLSCGADYFTSGRAVPVSAVFHCEILSELTVLISYTQLYVFLIIWECYLYLDEVVEGYITCHVCKCRFRILTCNLSESDGHYLVCHLSYTLQLRVRITPNSRPSVAMLVFHSGSRATNIRTLYRFPKGQMLSNYLSTCETLKSIVMQHQWL